MDDQPQSAAPQTPGRALVRKLLVDRLNEYGMTAKRGVTKPVQEATENRLCQHLAYMGADNLMTLAETLIDNHPDGIWPTEMLIRQWAHRLQVPPPETRPIVTSWLASVEGPKAMTAGHLVELYRWLRAKGRPPLSMDDRQIREEAAGNARRRQLITERAAPSAEDLAWLRSYQIDETAAREIVAAGNKNREGARA